MRVGSSRRQSRRNQFSCCRPPESYWPLRRKVTREAFLGVVVVKAQRAGIAVGDGILRAVRPAHHDGQKGRKTRAARRSMFDATARRSERNTLTVILVFTGPHPEMRQSLIVKGSLPKTVTFRVK